jgi:glycine cleavage system H lipoate-binding protein/ABC-type phosphate transport system substrate-binding protein
MKTKVLIAATLAFGLLLFGNSQKGSAENNEQLQGSVKLISSPSLNGIAGLWVKEFTRLNPGADIQLVSGADQLRSANAGLGGILRIVTEKDLPGSDENGWRVVVARDIVVPVFNRTYPRTDEIVKHGITLSDLASALRSEKPVPWGTFLGNGDKTPVTIYMADDASVKTALAQNLELPSTEPLWVKIVEPAVLLSAIQNDRNAIGLCRFVDMVNPDGASFAYNVALLPIDKNGNGKMDYMENIYDNPSEFLRGVWIGKYPATLSSEIFLVAGSRPDEALELAFINWVLTGGQSLLGHEGLCDLVNSEKQTQLDKVNITSINPAPVNTAYVVLKWIAIFLAIIIAIPFIADFVLRKTRKRAHAAGRGAASLNHFDGQSVQLPGGLFYDKTHSWAFLEPNGLVKVGIDDFMVHITGKITRIEMKQPGEMIKKGDPLCTIVHDGKQLRLYAPVSGTIKNCNPLLSGDASAMNRSPYAEGWIYEMEPANWLRELDFLSMADKYREWMKSEFVRLRDFIASTLQANQGGLSPLVLQDGGTLVDHVLSDMEPGVWEDFQSQFIDHNR